MSQDRCVIEILKNGPILALQPQRFHDMEKPGVVKSGEDDDEQP